MAVPPGSSVTESTSAPLPDAAHDEPADAAHVQLIADAPAGSASVTAAPITVDGPALATVTVYTVVPPGVAVSVPSVLVIDRSAWANTVVVSVAVLLAGVGSTPTPGMVTVAVFDSTPANAGSIVASTMNVAVPPATRSIVAEMLPVPVGLSHVDDADAAHVHDTPESGAGTTSSTGALAIVDGPLLVTTIEYWIDVPAMSVTLPSVLVIDRSAFGLMVVDADAVLFDGSGSLEPAGAATAAVLTIVPVALGATVAVTLNVTLPPTTRSTVAAMLPLIGPTWSQLPPADGAHVHDTAVRPAGMMSLTGASLMSDGPALPTTTV